MEALPRTNRSTGRTKRFLLPYEWYQPSVRTGQPHVRTGPTSCTNRFSPPYEQGQHLVRMGGQPVRTGCSPCTKEFNLPYERGHDPVGGGQEIFCKPRLSEQHPGSHPVNIMVDNLRRFRQRYDKTLHVFILPVFHKRPNGTCPRFFTFLDLHKNKPHLSLQYYVDLCTGMCPVKRRRS